MSKNDVMRIHFFDDENFDAFEVPPTSRYRPSRYKHLKKKLVTSGIELVDLDGDVEVTNVRPNPSTSAQTLSELTLARSRNLHRRI